GGSPVRYAPVARHGRSAAAASRYDARRSRRSCFAGGRGSKRGSCDFVSHVWRKIKNKSSDACEFFQPLGKAFLSGLRRPGGQVVAFDGGRELRRWTEESSCLGALKSCKPRRLKIGRAAVGRLDQFGQAFRQLRRQAKADVDGGEQTAFDRLEAVADHRLERRDHVADHVFRRVVQKQRAPARLV